MYFLQSEMPEIKHRDKSFCKDIVEDFISSGFQVAEVFADGDFNNNNDMCRCINIAAKSTKLPAKAVMRNGRVFLTRVSDSYYLWE